MKKVKAPVFYLGFSEEAALEIHRLLKEEIKKDDVSDEVLKSWIRLDYTMKKRGVKPE